MRGLITQSATIVARSAFDAVLRYRYRAGVKHRAAQYRDAGLTFAACPDVADAVKEHGYVILREFFDPEGLHRLGSEIDQAIAEGALGPTDDPHPSEEANDSQTHVVYVPDPLAEWPSTLRYAFSEELIDIAATFHGCPPLLVACKLFKSFSSEAPAPAVYQFHYDGYSARFLKLSAANGDWSTAGAYRDGRVLLVGQRSSNDDGFVASRPF